MNIFIKFNHKSKGIDRFLQSFSIYEGCKLFYVNNIQEANRQETDIAIYGGFLPQELLYAHPQFKYYTFCSPFGQADLSGQNFLSPEIDILYYVVDLIKNGKITGTITSSKALAWSFDSFIYVPPVKVIDQDDIHFTLERQNYSMIGNNFRKHRNVVNQIAAVSRLTPKEKICVAGDTFYKPFESLFNCEFYSKDLPDKDYYKAISQHKMNFQCSWSESFSYITLEYALMGVPTIVSPCIDWVKSYILRVNNPDNPQEIYQAAQSLLNNKELYEDISEGLVSFAQDINKINQEQLYKVINENIVALL